MYIQDIEVNTESQAAAGPARARPEPGAAHRPARGRRARAGLGLGRAGCRLVCCIYLVYLGCILDVYLGITSNCESKDHLRTHDICRPT